MMGAMAFHIYHRSGECEANPDVVCFDALYDELATADDEHPDVSVEHESGWSLGAGSSGRLVWENVENDDPPRHMRSVTRSRVLELWGKLADGNLDAIESEAWQDGYG
jgi:hypothetical protein